MMNRSTATKSQNDMPVFFTLGMCRDFSHPLNLSITQSITHCQICLAFFAARDPRHAGCKERGDDLCNLHFNRIAVSTIDGILSSTDSMVISTEMILYIH